MAPYERGCPQFYGQNTDSGPRQRRKPTIHPTFNVESTVHPLLTEQKGVTAYWLPCTLQADHQPPMKNAVLLLSLEKPASDPVTSLEDW